MIIIKSSSGRKAWLEAGVKIRKAAVAAAAVKATTVLRAPAAAWAVAGPAKVMEKGKSTRLI